MKKVTSLEPVGGDVEWDIINLMPPATEFDIMQVVGGKWVGVDQVNGGNF